MMLKYTDLEDLERQRKRWRYTWEDCKEDARRFAVAVAWSLLFWSTIVGILMVVALLER